MIQSICRFSLMVLITVAGVTVAAENITLRAVPTYECCGVYLEGSSLTPDQVKVEYRKEGSANWLAAHPLTNSINYKTPRGSLFNLKSGTRYQIQALDKSGKAIAKSAFTTWNDTPPIHKTIKMSDYNPGNGPVMIEGGGTPDGWVRYVGDGKTVINGGDRDIEALLIENGSFIILENLIIKGGWRHGIRLLNCKNIRIINCDISGFGRLGKQRLIKAKKRYDNAYGKYYDEKGKSINWDAGVYIDNGEKITIERNYIHDPRNHANSWYYSHPAGPNAVFVKALGEIVIRYNDFIGSNQHRWNDVIEGYGNGNANGGFSRDSDIYGNYLAFSNDDGIELDGGQCNVRFFGNKVEGSLCGISTAPNMRGPSYIFNNLVCNLGDERGSGSAGVKNGGGDHSPGRSYFYNNTFFTKGKGIAAIGFGRDKNRSDYLATTRNNILAVTGAGISNQNTLKDCSFDFDQFTNIHGGKGKYSLPDGFEKHATFGDPGFESPVKGLFALKAGGSGLVGAQAVVGLNEGTYRGCLAPESKGLMPLRSNGIKTDVNQLIFTALKSDNKPVSGRVNVAFAAKKNNKKFRILKNKAFDWLKVSPLSGVVDPAKTVVLNVTVDPSKVNGTGVIPGAFLVRTDDGHSVPVSVFMKVFQSDFNQTIKAVDCAGADQFKALSMKDTGEKYLDFASDTPRKPGKKSITLNLDAPFAGEYYVKIRVNCPEPGGNHDSIFFSVNGGDLKTGSVMPGNFWHWVALGSGSPTMKLNKGKNTILLMPREDIALSEISVSAMTFMPGEKWAFGK